MMKGSWRRIEKREVVDAESLYREIGRRFRAAREAAGKTQGDVAQALMMTRACVANIEAGKQAIMIPHLYNLALYLKLNQKTLLP